MLMSLTNKTNASRIASDIPSFNISDVLSPYLNIISRSSSWNFPCGLGIVNLASGREQSKKNNYNK
jgi:hypothetical protein